MPSDRDDAPPRLTAKQRQLLSLAAGECGMYRGDRWDFAPRQYARLEAMGLVSEETPHNPSHKPRAVITAAGKAALAAAREAGDA